MTEKQKLALNIPLKDLILGCGTAAYLLRMIMYGAGPEDAISLVIVITIAIGINTLLYKS